MVTSAMLTPYLKYTFTWASSKLNKTLPANARFFFPGGKTPEIYPPNMNISGWGTKGTSIQNMRTKKYLKSNLIYSAP